MELDSCAEICVNTYGTFHCACNVGYTLNNDGVTCRGTTTIYYSSPHTRSDDISMQTLMNAKKALISASRSVTTLMAPTPVIATQAIP